MTLVQHTTFHTAWAELDAAMGRMYQAKNADQLGAAFADAANELRAAAAFIRREGYPGLPLPKKEETDSIRAIRQAIQERIAHAQNARID